jgi:hypothetical protein
MSFKFKIGYSFNRYKVVDDKGSLKKNPYSNKVYVVNHLNQDVSHDKNNTYLYFKVNSCRNKKKCYKPKSECGRRWTTLHILCIVGSKVAHRNRILNLIGFLPYIGYLYLYHVTKQRMRGCI